MADGASAHALARRWFAAVRILGEFGFFCVDDERSVMLHDHLFADDNFLHTCARRHVVHDVEHGGFEDGAETSSAAVSFERQSRHRSERAFRELQLHAVHVEQALVLLDQAVARLGENVDERVFVELVERGDDGQATDEFRDQTELEQVFGLHLREHIAELELFLRFDVGTETQGVLADATLNDVVEADEGSAADEENVGRIDLQEILLRMFTTTLRRNVGDGAFDDLQESLLNTFARDVTRDARVVALAADLVDFVDVHDAALRSLDVVIGVLQKLHDDVFDVFTDITRFGQRRRIGDGERNVDDLRQRLREQGFSGPRRPKQENVRLLQLDIVRVHAAVDALVVVVHSHRENLLRAMLSNDVLVEDRFDVRGFWNRRRPRVGFVLLNFLGNDVVAEPNALVADVDRRTGNELLHFFLGFAAERAAEIAVRVIVAPSLHFAPLTSLASSIHQRCDAMAIPIARLMAIVP